MSRAILLAERVARSKRDELGDNGFDIYWADLIDHVSDVVVWRLGYELNPNV
jgi:hypothetical protein